MGVTRKIVPITRRASSCLALAILSSLAYLSLVIVSSSLALTPYFSEIKNEMLRVCHNNIRLIKILDNIYYNRFRHLTCGILKKKCF